MLAEEDKYVTHLREKIKQLAEELRVRTEALEQAYERVRGADQRTVEMHGKFVAEFNARTKAEAEAKRAQDDARRLQGLLELSQRDLERARDDVERLEAEKAEAESAAGRARAVARELKQTIKVGRGVVEGRAEKEALAAAYERGKAEGEASATIKALAAFDKLMETDDMADWDDEAKKNTRQEIRNMRKSSPDRARSPQPSPPKRKWSIRRGSNPS